MGNLKKLVLVGMFSSAAVMLSACGGEGSSIGAPSDAEVELDASYYTDTYGWNASGGMAQTQLGRGLNLGNYLEAPNEGEWTGGRLLVEQDLQIIADAGFKTVRIPVRWSNHAGENTPYQIDASFMARVKQVVGWSLAANLKVVLNVHHYEEMMNDGQNQQENHILRLVGMWAQIAEAFPLSEYDEDSLVFELLNEPNGTIGYDDWNDIIGRLTQLIWTTMADEQNNGTEQRTIMIGTANWGHPDGLTQLDLPSSVSADNTIITVHYYEPFHFTHQGADWVQGADEWIGTPWLGTASDQQPLIDLFDRVTAWNAGAGRGFEIFMGEYGVFSQYSDPDHQRAWTAFIAREAEKRNISWAYWEYASGFGAYDPEAGEWRSALIEGLIPAQP
ncbi:glycoside hydrolase family 5 protein [Agarivorans sp. 1_MG-2023]|uniref:glycoside hydrolase family 5 protein n=1 Tax=Agarivorans sp. 1_MG-2023 TaxID=3062634 RepID=UPI0026E3B162|nr:glycoside hydrolase family 5 protein [Agarivorans sp. 1_MG-2023]MDO6765249.1 glycoside hydrolase family 5 protein [Agarivorans sp. 1_MG-2023]